MKPKVDRRILKTRALLLNSLLKLLDTKPFRDITIKDLTNLADVAKPTFYRNYSSVQDILLNELDYRAEGYMDEISEVIDSCKYFNEITFILFSRFNDNGELFLAMYKAEMDNYIIDRYIQYTTQMMEIVNKNHDQAPDLARIFYFAGGTHCLFKHWLLAGRPRDIMEMSDILANDLYHLVKDKTITIK